jgi:hypothetical protein
MSYDACISIRHGALQTVYGQYEAPIGHTYTIGSPKTFTLYNSLGNVVLGPIAAAGADSGAGQIRKVWYVLATSGLAVGDYYGVFTCAVTDNTDSTSQTLLSDLQIVVLPDVEIIANYDDTALQTGANSQINQTRLHLSDTSTANAIWSDNEILYFLSAASGVPILAASLALEALAVDKAKLANAIQIGSYGNGEKEVYTAVVERAARLRMIAPAQLVVDTVDPIFTMGQTSTETPGSMDNW